MNIKTYPDISIVIANFNGEKHLKEFLTQNIKALKAYSGRAEIIVCDDFSADNSLKFVEQTAAAEPLLKYCTSKNKGLPSARNTGAEKALYPYILYIDNDVLLEENYLNKLARHITADTFAIACCGYSYYNREQQIDGIKLLYWRRGMPRFTKNILNNKLPSAAPILSMGVQGAYFLCSKQKLQDMGGFDELLNPYMYEETDFSYRGLKRGWKITYAPEVKAWHKVGGTINSKVNPYTKLLSVRNRHIFVWKNIHSRALLVFYLFFLLTKIIFPKNLRAFKEAFKMRKDILEKRRIEKLAAVYTDKEIFKMSEKIEQGQY